MISQTSHVTFPVNWTKIVNFARNSGFGRQMAKNVFINLISTLYDCIF